MYCLPYIDDCLVLATLNKKLNLGKVLDHHFTLLKVLLWMGNQTTNS